MSATGVSDGRTTISHSSDRTETIDVHRQRVLQEQLRLRIGSPKPIPTEFAERVVTFNVIVDNVEPNLSHACSSLSLSSCVSASGGFPFSACMENAHLFLGNDDQRPQRTCQRCHWTRTDHFDAVREGETLNVPSIPPYARSHVLPAYDLLSSVISSGASLCSIDAHSCTAQPLVDWTFGSSHFTRTVQIVRPCSSDR